MYLGVVWWVIIPVHLLSLILFVPHPVLTVMIFHCCEHYSFPLCTPHYITVYKHFNTKSVIECGLWGSKHGHCASGNLHLTFRPATHPERVDDLVREARNFEGCITADNLACNRCYVRGCCSSVMKTSVLLRVRKCIHLELKWTRSRIVSGSVAISLIIMKLQCYTHQSS